jgi:hypothetical protein
VHSKLARFTKRCVALYQEAVGIHPVKTIREEEGGYADWVIIAIHGLRRYLDLPYRRLLDALSAMTRIVGKLGLSVDELPDFTTKCARKQELKMGSGGGSCGCQQTYLISERFRRSTPPVWRIASAVAITPNVSATPTNR